MKYYVVEDKIPDNINNYERMIKYTSFIYKNEEIVIYKQTGSNLKQSDSFNKVGDKNAVNK